MKHRNSGCLTALLVLVSLALSCGFADAAKWDITKLGIEKKAPNFTLEDLDGNKVALSDFKGKVVLLIFSTTWCPLCREEIPGLKKLYAEHGNKGLVILSIDVQESRRKVAAFASAQGIPYTVLPDPDGVVARLYNVRGVPTKVLIDRDGIIKCHQCRSAEALLPKLMGEKGEGSVPGKK